MPLSHRLANVVLSRPCPYCGHALNKKGSWFKTISSYNCKSCQKQVQMGYDAKVKLFDKHAHQ